MEILPYDVDKILSELRTDKFYFDKIVSWEKSMLDCLRACRILKTLEKKHTELNRRFNVAYKNKFFYKKNVISFEYDSDSYTITVNLGLEVDERIVQWRAYHEVFEGIFNRLLMEMKKELPVERSKELERRLEQAAAQ